MKLGSIALTLALICALASAHEGANPCGLLTERIARLATLDGTEAQELWREYASVVRKERDIQMARDHAVAERTPIVTGTADANIWTYETGHARAHTGREYDPDEQGHLRDRLFAIDRYLNSPASTARQIVTPVAARTFLGDTSDWTPHYWEPLPATRPAFTRARCFRVATSWAISLCFAASAYVANVAYVAPTISEIRKSLQDRAGLNAVSPRDVSRARSDISSLSLPIYLLSLGAFTAAGWGAIELRGTRNLPTVVREIRDHLRGVPELKTATPFVARHLHPQLASDAVETFFQMLQAPPAHLEPVRFRHLGFSFVDGSQVDLLLESRNIDDHTVQWRGSVVLWPGEALAP